MKRLKTSLIITFFSIFALTGVLSAESVAEKSKHKQTQSLKNLVFLEVPMKNFGTEEQRKSLNDIKIKYQSALAFHLEGDYLNAYRGFLEIQESIYKLYEDVSLAYVTKTGKLLQDSSLDVVNLSIRYDKKSQRFVRFRRDIDKTKKVPETRAYDEKELHFAYDKRHILNNLKVGYGKYGLAKKARQKALNVEKYFEPTQLKASQSTEYYTDRVQKFRIDNFQAVIKLCREAKLAGIKVFQLTKPHRLYKAQVDEKIKDNYYLIEGKLNPIFDLRIPEQYRIDASDSFNRVHDEEVCLKKDLKPAKECSSLKDS